MQCLWLVTLIKPRCLQMTQVLIMQDVVWNPVHLRENMPIFPSRILTSSPMGLSETKIIDSESTFAGGRMFILFCHSACTPLVSGLAQAFVPYIFLCFLSEPLLFLVSLKTLICHSFQFGHFLSLCFCLCRVTGNPFSAFLS